jgi:hypothetical protein
MCEILGGVKIDGFTIIDCTPYDGPYVNATILRIFAKDSVVDNSVFETSDFSFENFTRCFTSDVKPSVVTKANIPERFLTRGNKIEFK